jgi:hypothetical protein
MCEKAFFRGKTRVYGILKRIVNAKMDAFMLVGN